MNTSTVWQMARRAERMNPSIIREILKVTERPGIISLAGGLPSPESFPIEAMREASARVLRDTPKEALQYAASEGYAATPLTGVWANFPYLHNGSVPTLHDLLGPASERPKIFDKASTSSARC